MIKKENGVTLTILLVTIVIMIILAGVIMSISMSLTKTSDIKEIVANMELIRGVASDYRNKYLDDSEIERDDNNNITSIKVSTKFIGTKEDPHQANSIIQQLLRSTYLDSEFLNFLNLRRNIHILSHHFFVLILFLYNGCCHLKLFCNMQHLGHNN